MCSVRSDGNKNREREGRLEENLFSIFPGKKYSAFFLRAEQSDVIR
jgi:hypothetical protein